MSKSFIKNSHARPIVSLLLGQQHILAILVQKHRVAGELGILILDELETDHKLLGQQQTLRIHQIHHDLGLQNEGLAAQHKHLLGNVKQLLGLFLLEVQLPDPQIGLKI